MDELEKFLEHPEVATLLKNLRGPTLQIFMSLMISIILTAETKAEEITPLPTPIDISIHPSNQKRPESIDTLIKNRIEYLTAVEKKIINEGKEPPKPSSEKEINDLITIGQHLEIPELQERETLTNTSYINLNIKLIQKLKDPYAEICDPKSEIFGIDLDTYQTPITIKRYKGENDEDLLYIKIDDFFGKNIIPTVRKALIEEKDIEYVVLDLSENGGGLQSNAIGLLNLFFSEGIPFHKITSQSKIPFEMTKEETDRFPTKFLTIVINGRSASATEQTVLGFQTLADKKTLIIGDESVGKYYGQTLYSLFESGITIKYSTFYYDQNHPGSGVGIKPEIYAVDIMKQWTTKKNIKSSDLVGWFLDNFGNQVVPRYILSGDIKLKPKKQE